MKQKLTTPIPVKKALKKLGKDIREARIRRRIPVALMAERVGISRVTLKSVEDGRPTVSMGIYATALYVLGMLDRLSSIVNIFDILFCASKFGNSISIDNKSSGDTAIRS